MGDVTNNCNCTNIELEIKKFRNHLNAYQQYLAQFDEQKKFYTGND